MRKGRMILLVGQIASGKTTRAREYAKMGAVIVSGDAIVEAVHAGDYSAYREEHKPIYKAAADAIVLTALALGRTVVIDRTNLTKASRARFIALARSLDCDVDAVVFPLETAATHAQRRADSDCRGLTFTAWLRVAERKEKEIEWPTAEEGLDTIFYHRPPDA